MGELKIFNMCQLLTTGCEEFMKGIEPTQRVYVFHIIRTKNQLFLYTTSTN
jgi:hypothetical protein